MVIHVEWLQLMSRVRDRVRGRAPLILVLSGALLMLMGGWPVRCTAMPKDLLLANSSGNSDSTVKCDLTNFTLPPQPKSDSDQNRESASGRTSALEEGGVGGGGAVGDDSAEKSNVRVLLRTDRSVPSINSNVSSVAAAGTGTATVRLRHRMHSASAMRNSRASGSTSNRTKSGSNLERNERSANLSHITSKIQLFIKNRLLQILPDGSVNGTQDDSSDYTILQRTAVDIGKIRIQSVATCMFLCMDACGNAYASKESTDDCVFNEAMELHHYNTYSSAKHSNSRRILYLALNRHGQTRKIHIPNTRSLGKLSTYTNALTHPVEESVTRSLLAKLFGPNHVRHGLKQLCDSPKVHLRPLTAPTLIPRPKCTLNERLGKRPAPAALLSPAKKGKKKGPVAKRCKGEDGDGDASNTGDCVRPTAMQMLVPRKKGPQKQSVIKCTPGDDNCFPKKANKRRPNNNVAAARPGVGGGAAGKIPASNPNHNGKRRKVLPGPRTTTVPTTTTLGPEEEDVDNTEEEGGVGALSSELDDPALADDSSIILPTNHHPFNFNRLSSSLADEDEADFD